MNQDSIQFLFGNSESTARYTGRTSMSRIFAVGLSLSFWGAANGFHTWIGRRHHAARRLTVKPRVEELEDRTVLSQLIVLASGLDLLDVLPGVERGGIYIVRPDGTGLK